MSRLVTVDIDRVRGEIRSSIAAVLERHGALVVDKILDECGRNASHAVAMLDVDDIDQRDMVDEPNPSDFEPDLNATLGIRQSVFG